MNMNVMRFALFDGEYLPQNPRHKPLFYHCMEGYYEHKEKVLKLELGRKGGCLEKCWPSFCDVLKAHGYAPRVVISNTRRVMEIKKDTIWLSPVHEEDKPLFREICGYDELLSSTLSVQDFTDNGVVLRDEKGVEL